MHLNRPVNFGNKDTYYIMYTLYYLYDINNTTKVYLIDEKFVFF